jgi:hypothetical protein
VTVLIAFIAIRSIPARVSRPATIETSICETSIFRS